MSARCEVCDHPVSIRAAAARRRRGRDPEDEVVCDVCRQLGKRFLRAWIADLRLTRRKPVSGLAEISGIVGVGVDQVRTRLSEYRRQFS